MIRETTSVNVSWTGTHHHPGAPRDRRHLAQPHEHHFTMRVGIQLDLAERGTVDSAILRERVWLWALDHLAGPHDMTLERMARAMLDQLRVWYGRDRGLTVDLDDGTGCGAQASLPYVGRPGRPPRAEVPV